MDAPFYSSQARMMPYGSLQFAGTDVELVAWPTDMRDFNIVVFKSRREIYRVTLRGMVSMWIEAAPRAAIEHHINIDDYRT